MHEKSKIIGEWQNDRNNKERKAETDTNIKWIERKRKTDERVEQKERFRYRKREKRKRKRERERVQQTLALYFATNKLLTLFADVTRSSHQN